VKPTIENQEHRSRVFFPKFVFEGEEDHAPSTWEVRKMSCGLVSPLFSFEGKEAFWESRPHEHVSHFSLCTPVLPMDTLPRLLLMCGSGGDNPAEQAHNVQHCRSILLALKGKF